MPRYPVARALLAEFWDWLYSAALSRRVPAPGPSRFTARTEDPDMKRFDVTLHLPPVPAVDPGAPPITAQTVVLTVDGTAQAPLSPPLDTADLPVVSLADGGTVSAAHTYTNDKGYTGPETTDAFTADAAKAPPAPGVFGFSAREVDVPDAPPTPPPADQTPPAAGGP